MVAPAKKLLAELSRPGPHQVLYGDLALVGLPGLVVTPRRGLDLPAVAFGHGWMQPLPRYRSLLRHLASWGIVVAAPATQRGPLPSHRLFAADLITALDMATKVRLGDGRISIDTGKLGVVGHSFGGGAAVLAAAEDARIRSVVTISPTESRPSAIQAAGGIRVPALHLAAAEDRVAPPEATSEPLATAWAGPVQYRTLAKADHLGVTEGRHWSELLMDGRAAHRPRRLATALTTAFLLRVLTGNREVDPLLEHDVSGANLEFSRRSLPAAKLAAAKAG
ncbi:dienelactone hydrolase family protein [Actinoalloteichus hymeniacidonis]|uniref:Dienelactone hydrolase-like enzyme n=1 Tax=Actinoalloteichus hymeniacidonis TaxID=340345 RepID=A0AAC9HUT3_9PSEU|nr:dienelactone hydrolase family protein [Actinoalloteichus hymeniacidonis]AOS65754.1 dienelactone hydrolase-like enzyme [Actinoalloteichus hymeniacidonis]MBB5906156.1 dienelactone hydrolase [Actinoalloteichus hymeniacidonis]